MIRGGKSYVSSPPAFSNDAKKLLVCTGNSVTIFSTSTGLKITELEGHTELVTSVIVVPASTPASKILCYCWTASLDGTIKYWDFSGPELIKTIKAPFPICSMVIPGLLSSQSGSNEKPPDLFAYLSVDGMKGQKKQKDIRCGQILKCNLTKSCLVIGSIFAESKKPERIAISSTGKYLGIREKHKLRIWELPAKEAEIVHYKKIRLCHTKSLSVLAFHPTERIVAAGDVTGRILIWRDFGMRTFAGDKQASGRFLKDEEERPGVRENNDADSCTTWHWHSAEVKFLLFSSDGAYLYSGGKEGVLVIWHLDTGNKKFLPRIGAPLINFTNSPDPSLSSISCADNQIHMLKMPSMEILKSICGIKLPCSIPEMYKESCSSCVFDHTAGLVALRSENYCIQLYSLFDDREVSEVQVCERNHQPGDDVTVIVNLVALSVDGSVMSTVETRLSEEGIGGLVSLKFWERGLQNKGFSLSTVIYEPHRDAGVSGIAFHPNRDMAVTSSYGGDFKIWTSVKEKENKMLRTNGWTCHAVGSYKKKSMTAAAFSADGSVLAVAAEKVITLWDPEKNVLVGAIGSTLEPIVNLSFIGAYLISASEGSNPQLSLWSMSKLSVSWSYKLHVEAVTCRADDSYFAVLALLPASSIGEDYNEQCGHRVDGNILLFNAGDPVPVASWFVKKARGGGLAFIQRSKSLEDVSAEKLTTFLLAYVNGNHEYCIFDPHGTEMDERILQWTETIAEPEETGRFGYSSMYGELPEFNMKEAAASEPAIALSNRPWETIFSGSSHTLPPLSKLCTVFLESLLERRTETDMMVE